MRLIDADLLLANMESNGLWQSRARYEIEDAPTVDAVEVVRCKDCKHKMTDEILLTLAKNKDTALFCERMGGVISEMFYCGAGERRS